MTAARILRADRLQQSMNVGKEQRVAGFIRDYRLVAVHIGCRQWRLLFQTRQINKNMPATDLNQVCGAAPVQMATRQVAEQLKSWVSDRANEFADIVHGCKLPPEQRKQLYASIVAALFSPAHHCRALMTTRASWRAASCAMS